MLLSDIGEFDLLKRIKKLIRVGPSVIKGIGDDCAVLEFSKDMYQLATCDMLIEAVDFTRRDNPYLIGRKALAVSISDIAACGGIPHHALVSLGAPLKTSLRLVDRIIKGMVDLAKAYKINIIGGDLSRAKNLTIDVSMLGIIEKRYLVLRNRAKVRDIIFVSGKLGGSISGRHLRFIPRLKEARFLVKNFKINSMIDISDGLTQDLGHILKASKVGAVIYEKLIPVSNKAKNLDDALCQGEDFELLFTMSGSQAKKLLKKNLKIFRPIGEITQAKYGLRLVDKNGRERMLKPKGFRHF